MLLTMSQDVCCLSLNYLTLQVTATTTTSQMFASVVSDRLYFTIHPVVSCKSAHVHYFCIDSEFVYAK